MKWDMSANRVLFGSIVVPHIVELIGDEDYVRRHTPLRHIHIPCQIPIQLPGREQLLPNSKQGAQCKVECCYCPGLGPPA